MKRIAKFQAGGEAEIEPPFVRRRQAREEAARAAEAEGDGRAARRERLRNFFRFGPRTQEEADILEAYRTNRDVSEIRREREAGGRAAAPAPAPAPAAPTPAAPAPAASSRGRQVQRPPRPAPATPAPTADYEERMQRGSLPAGRSATPGPMGEYSERAAAGAAARPLPAQRQAPRPRYSEADIARIRGIMEGGDIQPREPNLDERIGAFMDRNLGQIGLRRTNETGEGAPSTGSLRGDLQALGRALGFKKGGMVKPKKYQEGGPVKVPGKKPAMGGPKAPATRMRDMISPEERRELDAPLTRQELDRMRESGFKKGGAVKAPAKKMKSGGKVPAPKKMMKGGMTSKPKKMMGGGRAMYAKGGMARGCK